MKALRLDTFGALTAYLRKTVFELTSGNGADVVFDTLHGVDTIKYDVTASAEILDELRTGFDTSVLTPPALLTFPLAAVAEAYQAVQAGTAGSKVVLLP